MHTHTWAHVARCSARLGRHLAGGGKTKIGDEDVDIVSALRRHENVLRLEVPVIDATFVAVLEGVDDLD